MTAVQAPPQVALRRLAGLRHTSPGRLQLMLAVLLALACLAGLVTGLTAWSAGTGTADLRDRAQPLLAEAETIHSSLADADTTAALAFLTGGLEPPALTARYDKDLADAATALTSAAGRVPGDGPAAAAIRAVSTGLTDYAALVATARALNRQGKPVGAAYLSTASKLNRETLQPQAEVLFRQARHEAEAGYTSSRSSWWLTLLGVLIAALAVTLIVTQTHLSRSTHRTFNLPLVTASALTLLLLAGAAVVFAHQRSQLTAAGREGSAPVDTLAEIRILVLRERADEALTLAARAGSGALEAEFTSIRGRVTFGGPELDGVRDLMGTATGQHDTYVSLHEKIRSLDDGGDYEGAVRLAVGDETTNAFDQLTKTLDEASADRRAAFDGRIESAGRGLGSLTVLGPLLALVICLFAVIGLRARLEEYR
ncbi:hypothetical protein [Actinoplanes derwentensis]|uniref:Secreted protein n=1 Tax=Actinoplanes derwentensis TaxID=113562 RepID=A0A1H1Q908_9ACTN|nr:hypothetical protein [Actinoplanes derwentensis]GID82202.1 hypothetical protein Ade03nite_11260 [Actinoplanes derwentensis]SDS19915.1 hypothetical protein SAMN04489716_0239 [Actinoplanes derwentensis]